MLWENVCPTVDQRRKEESCEVKGRQRLAYVPWTQLSCTASGMVLGLGEINQVLAEFSY